MSQPLQFSDGICKFEKLEKLLVTQQLYRLKRDVPSFEGVKQLLVLRNLPWTQFKSEFLDEPLLKLFLNEEYRSNEGKSFILDFDILVYDLAVLNRL